MRFDGFLPGAVLIILVVTVLFALYGDNFVTRSSTSVALQADVPVAPAPVAGAQTFAAPAGSGAAPVQAMFGAPAQTAQGGPQFVAVAGTGNVGASGMEMRGVPAAAMDLPGASTTAAMPGQAATTAPQGNDFAPQVPPNFIPKKLAVDEAHWMGMDVRKLNHEMRVKLRYPEALLGILVGQVSMESSMSGLLGGDVITQVNNIAVTTLEEFQAATKTVKDLKEASMTVLRKTNVMDTAGRYQVRGMSLMLRTNAELGFAQLEGAPMIQPGDPRPHPDRGPCTDCHAIGTGWELTPDPDLMPMDPPPITQAQADHKLQPHQDRGPCIACHIIKAR